MDGVGNSERRKGGFRRGGVAVDPRLGEASGGVAVDQEDDLVLGGRGGVAVDPQECDASWQLRKHIKTSPPPTIPFVGNAQVLGRGRSSPWSCTLKSLVVHAQVLGRARSSPW